MNLLLFATGNVDSSDLQGGRCVAGHQGDNLTGVYVPFAAENVGNFDPLGDKPFLSTAGGQ